MSGALFVNYMLDDEITFNFKGSRIYCYPSKLKHSENVYFKVKGNCYNMTPSTITVKPIPLSRHEPTHAHDLILPLPCFTYLKHFSRNPERKHLDEIEMCAHNIIASLLFLKKIILRRKK